tara:strand:- start:3223 stop:3522 length:300 start_codon:yes stop_codon:yes gene_type:complete
MKKRNAAGQLLWSDGTIISMDNDFAIYHEPKRYPAAPPPMTKKEIADEKNRASARARHWRLKAEKEARLLAYNQFTYNFTANPTPSNPVHFSTGRNASV